MPCPQAKPAAFIAGAILALAIVPAWAQPAPDKATSAAQFNALLEYCGVASAELREGFKQRQKAAAGEAGIAPEAFEAAYARSYAKTRAILAEDTEEQKARICQQFKGQAG